jgi:signal peptidase I
MARLALRVLRVIAALALVTILAVPLVFAAIGAKSYVVVGQSMEPTYAPGDIVYVKAAGSYAVGDVVQVDRGGQYVHRIVAESPEGFTTCGDANCPDPRDRLAGLPDAEVVPASAVLGKVVAHLGGAVATIERWGATWPGRLVGAAACIALLWPWGEGSRGRAGRSRG